MPLPSELDFVFAPDSINISLLPELNLAKADRLPNSIGLPGCRISGDVRPAEQHDKIVNYFDDFLELGIWNPVVANVTQSSALLALLDEPVWFCLKAQPKREHLAAIALRRQFGIECFSPRLRFRKMTNRGPVWFVEAMFPGYLFAKFVYAEQHRAVESSHGIRGIVHFGDHLATLPENVVVALQSNVGAEEVVTIDSSIKLGQAVQIIEGPFRGLEVLVTQLLSARERVRVLFEFLGRSIEMEISTAKVLAA